MRRRTIWQSGLPILMSAVLALTACGSASSGDAAASVAEDAESGIGSEEAAEETGTESAADSEVSGEEQPEEASLTEENDEETGSGTAAEGLAQLDMTAWQYNEDDDVYYQVGISYCANPADASYENLAVFVPGAYMTAESNGDGTYTCALNTEGEVAGYTSETAPIVMPVNTPGYSAQSALTGYTDVTSYTDAGYVYVHAGCRGRDQGAPAGVTDLKAAIRYLRWIDDTLAGSAERIFVFGMSGGGAQSAILGASGDSDLYEPYLEAIGAVQGISDAVLGSMDWCPITNLDTADEAYEWMMGTTRTGLTEDETAISDALAEAYADYINAAELQDGDGNVLSLEESESGIMQAGSYYEYVKSVIEESLENFIEDTEFPYDASSSSNNGMGGMGGNRPGGESGGPGGNFSRPDGDFSRPDGDFSGPDGGAGGPGGDFSAPEETGAAQGSDADLSLPEEAENAAAESSGEDVSYESVDNISRTETQGGISLSGTYETVEDYIDALNADGEWVAYNAEDGSVEISSVADFAEVLKNASKSLGAFDQLDAGQGENTLFGYGDGEGAHFDSILAEILEELNSDYAADYEEDLEKTDSLGYTVQQRLNMYTPLYYLLASQEGYGTSEPAKYWRIRTGINQGDTSLTTEINLALALENYDGVESVDFETVWGEGHTMAERTGNSTENFISWVNECLGVTETSQNN